MEASDHILSSMTTPRSAACREGERLPNERVGQQGDVGGARAQQGRLIVLDLMPGRRLTRAALRPGPTAGHHAHARGEETDRIVGRRWARAISRQTFSPRELIARIKGVVRQARSLPRNLRADDAGTIAFTAWHLDTMARHLVSHDGMVTSLSGDEFQLLRIFLSHPNHVLTRDQLMMLAKGREADPLDRSIDILVCRLRQRLGDDPADPQIIKTVRGEGYVLAVAVEVER